MIRSQGSDYVCELAIFPQYFYITPPAVCMRVADKLLEPFECIREEQPTAFDIRLRDTGELDDKLGKLRVLCRFYIFQKRIDFGQIGSRNSDSADLDYFPMLPRIRPAALLAFLPSRVLEIE